MHCISATTITLADARGSVRATNVYEEQSLGVFSPEPDADALENDADYPAADGRVAIWGRYLGRHVRAQLSHGPPSICRATQAR